MDYYDTTTIPELPAGSESLVAGLGVALIIVGVILLAWIIFYLIGMVKLYKKCGKGGWEAIVPFYSSYVLVEIAGLNWWWFLLVIASSLLATSSGESVSSLTYIGGLASLFGNINVAYNMSKKFHKSTGWVVLAVIFSGIVYPILGYSSKEVYDASAPVSKNGLIDKDKAASPEKKEETAAPAPEANAAATPVTPVITPVAETPPEPAPVVPEAPEVTPGPDAADVAPVDTEATQPLQTETTSPIGLSEVNSDVVNVPTDENK